MISFFYASQIHKPRADRLTAELGPHIAAALLKAGAPSHKISHATLQLVARTIQYDLGLFDPPSFDLLGMQASVETMQDACRVIAHELSDSALFAHLAVHSPSLAPALSQASKWQEELGLFAQTLSVPKGRQKKLAVQRYISCQANVWREATGKWPPKTSNDVDGVTAPLALLIARLTKEASADGKALVPSLRQWRQGLAEARAMASL